MLKVTQSRIAGGALAATSLMLSACVDAGATSASEVPVGATGEVIAIALDKERCFGRTAPLPDGPYTASPTRPQPRIASPEPAINGTRDEPRFAIFNRTGEAIAQMYWMPSGSSDWGANRMEAGQTLARQQFCTASVTMPAEVAEAQCLFDMRAVTESGRVIENAQVRVCDFGRVIFE